MWTSSVFIWPAHSREKELSHSYLRIYTTKGRDRFHWAATPLKPYTVGNICYMMYRYSVLYCLWNIFYHGKRQFLWTYRNPETVIVPCFNVSRTLNRRTSQSLYIVSASVCSIKRRHIHPVRHAKHPKQILQTKHTFTTKSRGRPFDSAGERGVGLAVYVESEYLFPIFYGRQYLFSSIFSKDNFCKI